MGRRKLTLAEVRAYADLAEAARRLRRAQQRARKQTVAKSARRPATRQGVGNGQ